MKDTYDAIRKRIEARPFKIIGLGGIGCPVSLYLSKFLFGLNSSSVIYLIDGDEFELANKERMAFREIGNKASIKEAELAELFGDRVVYRTIPDYVTHNNIQNLVQKNDIVFLCVDNHKTRKLISEFCGQTSDILLISGGNDGIQSGKTGTFGNVQIYWRESGKNRTNSLTQFHPEIEHPKDVSPGDETDESCAVLVKRVPQLAFTNLAVASAMLNTLYTWASGKLHYEELYLDIIKAKMSISTRDVA
ncbi:hypothetical protein AYK24_02730 [Thermoplasmatales archaeon SG8-52-4]|nr:MAG: hypothetical protein AYK24_02730 [Thermoplasmatales archaeon SG8-52-4]